MKFDERDFDSMLENTMSDLPPEDIVQDVTPWKKSMHRVLIGLAFSSINLNFILFSHYTISFSVPQGG